MVCFDKHAMLRNVDGGMMQPGTQASGPADDSNFVHSPGDRGKYSRNGRISRNICLGTASAGTLGQVACEKNSLQNIVIIRFAKSAHLGS